MLCVLLSFPISGTLLIPKPQLGNAYNALNFRHPKLFAIFPNFNINFNLIISSEIYNVLYENYLHPGRDEYYEKGIKEKIDNL